MSKIIRREFIGSPIYFFILCLTGIGIPFAIIYFVSSLVTVEEEMEDPTEFLKQYRAGKLK